MVPAMSYFEGGWDARNLMAMMAITTAMAREAGQGEPRRRRPRLPRRAQRPQQGAPSGEVGDQQPDGSVTDGRSRQLDPSMAALGR
jgi:hypothetical protein